MSQSISQEFKFVSLLRFAFPSMVMMVFMSLYTIVDGVFISRLLGSNALSAANIIYPVFSILIAVGIMLATGGSAIVAIKMGEGKGQEARQNFSFITLVAFGFGVVTMILGNAFVTPIVKALGATPLIIENCKIYLGILLAFGPACVLQLIYQSFFVTAGKPGIGLAVTILGGITNAVLDYLLMGPFQMGIAGAAVATGMGQLIPALVGTWYFFFVKDELYFEKPKADRKVLLSSCTNGSSEMVTNLSNAVITYLFNMIMLKLLGEDGVAAITIVLYGQFLFNALYMGFSMGVAPIFSFNYGSGNVRLLRRVYKISILFIIVSVMVITGLALTSSSMIVGIFTPRDSSTFEIAARGFFLFSFNYLFAGINIFASSMFTAFSDGKVSAAISFLRTFGFLAASILLLPPVMGVEGVWLSVPLAEFLTLFVSVGFFAGKRKKYQYC